MKIPSFKNLESVTCISIILTKKKKVVTIEKLLEISLFELHKFLVTVMKILFKTLKLLHPANSSEFIKKLSGSNIQGYHFEIFQTSRVLDD